MGKVVLGNITLGVDLKEKEVEIIVVLPFLLHNKVATVV